MPSAPRTDAPESRVESTLRTLVRAAGGTTIKLVPNPAGIPDRLVILPGGRMYLVECKRSTGRVSPVQAERHRRLAAIGAPVVVLKTRGDIVSWLRAVEGWPHK